MTRPLRKSASIRIHNRQRLMPPGDNNHGERIVALETGQRALQETVQKLADVVGEQSELQGREHAQTRREISLLADRIGAVGKPNYGVIISAVTLVCLLVAAVLSPLHFQQQANTRAFEKLSDAFHHHEALPVHPVAAAILAEREKARVMETELRDKINQAQHALIREELKKP